MPVDTIAPYVPHAIVFAAALAATVSGYGFVLLASPLLLLLMAPVEAVPLSIALGWVVITTLLIRPAVWRSTDRRAALRLAGAGLLGIPVGTALLLSLDASLLRLVLGVVVATLALVTLASPSARRPAAGVAPVAERSLPARRPWSLWSLWPHRFHRPRWVSTLGAGFGAGVLSGASGLSGPMLVLYLSGRGLDKHRLRATTAAVIWCMSTVTLVLMSTSGQIPPAVWITAVTLVPALAAGLLIGGRIFRALPDRWFRDGSLAFASAAGALTALSGARALAGFTGVR